MIKVGVNGVNREVDKIYVHHNGEKREVKSVCYGDKYMEKIRYFCGYKAEDITGVEFIFEKNPDAQGEGTLSLGSNFAKINARFGNTESGWYIYVIIITKDQKRWLTTTDWNNVKDAYYNYVNAHSTTMFHDIDISCNVTFSVSHSPTWDLDWWTGLIEDLSSKISSSYTANVLFSPPQPKSFFYDSRNDGYLGLACSKGSGSITMTINSVKIGDRKLNVTFREGLYETPKAMGAINESRNNNGRSNLSGSGSSVR